MNPICCKCNKAMKVCKNGVPVIELSDDTPYKLYRADRFKCTECDIHVLSGFGTSIKRFEPCFKDMVKRIKEGEEKYYTF